jgi:hypothetical protein
MLPISHFDRLQRYRLVAPAFLRAAQRAFASADNFFRAAGLIGRRVVAFLAGVAGLFGAAVPFRRAQANFIASPIRFLAAGLIVRLRVAACDE